MKTMFTSLAICFCFLLSAQEKGVTPLKTKNHSPTTASTYAVVVGISDYQDEDIPDLRFADKDALAFAGFLQSPAGGSLDEDHLKVLINEKATVAQFAIALDWLWEVVKENDRVIIYFSGHGDVERKSITQPGYLLCWDAPSKIYLAGGALALPMFQDVITTLSVQNKAKVIVITDACRSGKLSGSSVGGAQITGSNLAKQYANEIKILSCQPDEFSIEGEQWGGGRGAFSYHLLDGLYGMADRDNDQAVSLREIDRYLEDHVTPEVAPQNQLPMVVGDSREKLTDIFPDILEQLKEAKKGEMPMFTATESRGIEDDVLAATDTNIVKMYFAFKKALEDKQFLFAEKGRAENDYADFYYKILSQEPQLERLHSSMRRNYAAALQDDAQQLMNGWMKTSQDQSLEISSDDKRGRLPIKVFSEKVKAFPACLDRAAELLGEGHYMYTTLKARKHFFEGYLLANSDRNPNKELGDKALFQFRQALKWQPELPLAYWQMIYVYGYNLLQPDSAEVYAQKAIKLHPFWLKPYLKLTFLLSDKYQQFDRAKPYLEQAMQIDSTSVYVLNNMGHFHMSEKEYGEAEKYFKKAIQLDSTFDVPYHNLGTTCYYTRRYGEAEKYFKKAIQLDSTGSFAYNNLGVIYKDSRRYGEAEKYLKKAIQLDSTTRGAYNNLGLVYHDTRRYSEAEKCLKKAIQLDSTYSLAYINLGNVYKDTRRYVEAEKCLKKAIQLDSTNVPAYNNLGLVYNDTRRYSEAEKYLKKAIQLDSTYVLAYSNLGNVYSATRRYAEAEKYLKKAIQLDSTFAKVYFIFGNMMVETHRYVESEKYFKKAIQFDSTDAETHNNLGNLYLITRRYVEAEHHFKKVIQLDPEDWIAYLNMSSVYQRIQRWEASEKMILKSIELGPSIVEQYAILGNAYTHLPGRLEDAKSILDKALERGPNYPDTYIYLSQWSLKKDQHEQAWQYLEQGLEKGFGNGELKMKDLQEEPDFAEIRKDPRWGELIGKYFSKEVKK